MNLSAFLSAHRVQALALSKQDGHVLFSPAAEVILEPGDRVVVAGDDAQLQHLKDDA